MNDEKLIELVKSQPAIYDKTNVFYSNKNHVKNVWKELAKEMQQTVPVCQKRWRYLRDYFVRQLHMTQNNTESSSLLMVAGSGATTTIAVPTTTTTTTTPTKSEAIVTEISLSSSSASSSAAGTAAAPVVGTAHVPQQRKRSFWPLFDKMSFLKPFSSTRKSRNNNNNNSNNNNNNKNNTNGMKTESKRRKIEETDQASILSVSSSNSHGEFNSFDYMTMYQTHYAAEIQQAQAQYQAEFQQQQQQQQDQDQDQFIEDVEEQQLLQDIEDEEQQVHHPGLLQDEPEPVYLDDESSINISNNFNIKNNSNYNNNNNSSRHHHHQHYRHHQYQMNGGGGGDDDDGGNGGGSTSRKRKKSDVVEEILSVLKRSEEQIECDEHEHFFKSLLNSVRKIDEEHIMSFRTEILQLIMKYRYMSQRDKILERNTSNTDVVVIDTGDINWRRNLNCF